MKQISLADLVKESGLTVPANGMVRCIFHDDKTPSLSISLSKGLFKCHGCGAHGDAVNWLMHRDGISQKEALDIVKPRGQAKKKPRKEVSRKWISWIGPKDKLRQLRIDYDDGSKSIRFPKGSVPKKVVYSAPMKRPELKASALVFAEGAKAADAIAAAGYRACGIPAADCIPTRGVLHWIFRKERPTWILWPDEDEIGLQAMAKVAADAPDGVEILWCKAPRLRKGADAADFTDEQIRETVATASQRPPMFPVADSTEKPDLNPETNSRNVPLTDSPKNCRIALQMLGWHLRWDEMRDCAIVVRDEEPEPIKDAHWDHLLTFARTAMNFSPSPMRKFEAYVRTIAREDSFHPILDYLDSCPGPDPDQTKDEKILACIRVIRETVGRGFSLEEDDYLSIVAILKALCAGVMRVRNPGQPWKYIPVLVGAQNDRKSEAIAALFPDKSWLLEGFDFAANTKERCESLEGVWCVEADEIDHIRGVSVQRVKSILSVTADKYRKAYGRELTRAPRKCFFIGTTNTVGFLTDTTGNVRFWPVRIRKPCDPDFIRENRDELWGAVCHLAPNEALYLDSGNDVKRMTERQEEARVSDPWESQIAAMKPMIDGYTTHEILEKLEATFTQRNAQRLSRILQKLRMVKERETSGSRKYVWTEK